MSSVPFLRVPKHKNDYRVSPGHFCSVSKNTSQGSVPLSALPVLGGEEHVVINCPSSLSMKGKGMPQVS